MVNQKFHQKAKVKFSKVLNLNYDLILKEVTNLKEFEILPDKSGIINEHLLIRQKIINYAFYL